MLQPTFPLCRKDLILKPAEFGMHVQPLQAERWRVAACRAVLVLLLWTNLLGVTLLESPCFPGCVLDSGSVCQVGSKAQSQVFCTGPIPSLCAAAVPWFFALTARAAVNIEHLEIRVMFYILVVSLFHYQWGANALKERDCSPIPAYSSVESVTFVLFKGFPGMDSRDAIQLVLLVLNFQKREFL